MAKYDLIIPNLTLPQTEGLALKCLQTIRAHSSNYRLIWIDNGGTGQSEALMAELQQHQQCVIITNEQNLGFVKAVNQGLAISNAPLIVIMNNDTEAVHGWLEKLSAPLQAKVIGMSGPRTTATNSWQGLCGYRGGTHVLGIPGMLAFFCVMMRRDVIEKVGLLDEDFGVGLGDDDNYCGRVHRAGYRLVLVADLVIPHNHRTTFHALYSQEQIDQMQKEALQMYRQKEAECA